MRTSLVLFDIIVLVVALATAGGLLLVVFLATRGGRKDPDE
jgi:hypothetical protein